jgi:hypothetical protein
MLKTILALVEIGLTIITFLLVLNLTTSMMYYYQQSTETMTRMMDRLQNTLPTNYSNPYSNVPENLMPGFDALLPRS